MNELATLKRIARMLRYRELKEILGHEITIRSLDQAAAEALSGCCDGMFKNVSFVSPERHFMKGAFEKYGILDLVFAVDGLEWQESDCGGIPLLREVGWQREPEDGEDSCGGPCLEDVEQELRDGIPLLKLFLRADRDKHRRLSADKPNFEFPSRFRLMDACLTNMKSIWLWKHFYL